MKPASTFRRQSFINAVQAASAAKDGARNLLLLACIKCEFDRPEVTVTKDQACDFLNTSRSTVQRALRELKAEGSLVPIRNAVGGHGLATTYSIRIVGQGDTAASVVAEGRGTALDDERERYFRAMARKHGAIKAAEFTDNKFGKL
ncbi:hypothetical protein G5B38_02390 [Pseudohalocynthiibacter aestuariivivens]|nr:helix-turn-helix domain-containing protein [Pseudohalocynthiibacter aestuariivivens]QIE44467.1 hypothetical protein G5B38_02390 [Pseudohalocynthiibacter aestuariivivens]